MASVPSTPLNVGAGCGSAVMIVDVLFTDDVAKQLKEIRNLRTQGRNISGFATSEIEELFDRKIAATIKTAVEAKTTELIGQHDGKAGRREEQRTALAMALESIFARIERGMTVEIRFLPPLRGEPADGGVAEADEPQEFRSLREIVPQLKFPAPDISPILSLPAPEPEAKPVKPEADTKPTKKNQS